MKSIENILMDKAQEWIQKPRKKQIENTSVVIKTEADHKDEIVPVAIICSFGKEIKRIVE
jgi:hypothetical protein